MCNVLERNGDVSAHLRCRRSWESHEAFADDLRRLHILGSVVLTIILKRLVSTVRILYYLSHRTFNWLINFIPFDTSIGFDTGSSDSYIPFHLTIISFYTGSSISFHLTLPSASMLTHPSNITPCDNFIRALQFCSI